MAFQNFPFLHLGPKNLNPINTIKIGVLGPFFWKAVVRHETAIFGPKNPKFINFSYHFFCLFSSLSTTKNTNICWNPYFYSVFANQKKREFSKNKLKTLKIEKTNFCTPFFEKGYFLDNWEIAGNQKTQNDNWAPKKSPETPIFIVRKWRGPVSNY